MLAEGSDLQTLRNIHIYNRLEGSLFDLLNIIENSPQYNKLGNFRIVIHCLKVQKLSAKFMYGRVKVRELAESKSAKLCARWIPSLLIPEQKRIHIRISAVRLCKCLREI